MGFIVLGCLVVLGVALYVDYLLANEFYDVAVTKGYEERRYFHFCFWLGIAGYLLVIALQPKDHKTAAGADLPEL